MEKCLDVVEKRIADLGKELEKCREGKSDFARMDLNLRLNENELLARCIKISILTGWPLRFVKTDDSLQELIDQELARRHLASRSIYPYGHTLHGRDLLNDENIAKA